jgi:hypothetical protein
MAEANEGDGGEGVYADHRLERGKSRLNRSVAALLARGFNSKLAEELVSTGRSLSILKEMDDAKLQRLGLSGDNIASLRRGGRSRIPFPVLAQLLWANRFTCCICRNPNLAIIVHHIRPWAQSHSHAPDNLAVLCLQHHAEAHRHGELEQNLTPSNIREAKQQWECAVALLDAKAILDASRINDHHWWWFNHLRLFEIADGLGVNLKTTRGFCAGLLSKGIDNEGRLKAPDSTSHFRYQGGDGQYLYYYVKGVLDEVLTRTAVFNVSDDLDPGFLSQVVSAGDIIFVQGKHYFKRLNGITRGPGQATEVRRQVNNVRLSFTIDRWEAVANSAWAAWLFGIQRAASIVRVVSISHEGNRLHLKCTGLAIGFTLEGLSARSYVLSTWPQDQDVDDDDFFDGLDQN